MPHDRDTDCFKTYPTRWVGYCSGFGVALKGPLSVTPVKTLHAVTTAFIFGHTLYKPYTLHQKHQSTNKMLMGAVDTGIYEVCASGVLPPAAAFIVRSGTATVFGRANKILRKWGPSLVATGVLVLISGPADALVDKLMDATVRTIY